MKLLHTEIAMEREMNELKAEIARLRQYLEDLTPGGSEFSNSPEICFQWVKQRLSISGKLATERNRLRAKLDEARGEHSRLLEMARQAVDNVDFDNRTVLSLAAMRGLKNAVDYYDEDAVCESPAVVTHAPNH